MNVNWSVQTRVLLFLGSVGLSLVSNSLTDAAGETSLDERAYIKSQTTPAENARFSRNFRATSDTLVVLPEPFVLEIWFDGDADGDWSNASQHSAPTYPGGYWASTRNAFDIEGDTLVVGAPRYSCPKGGRYCGAVFVYKKDLGGASNWGLEAILSTGVRNTRIGDTVIIQDNTIFASTAGFAASGTIGIYVFHDSDGNWNGHNADASQRKSFRANSHVQRIQGTNQTSLFGYSIDVDGSTLVTTNTETSGSEEGLFIYRDNDGDWSTPGYTEEAHHLRGHNWDPGDTTKGGSTGAFSISGDTVAAGAHCEDCDTGGIDPIECDGSNNIYRGSGAVFIFRRDSSGNWNQEAHIKASDNPNLVGFGQSVALSEDTLFVGTWGRDDSDDCSLTVSPNDGGRGYVFTRTGITWSEETELILKGSHAECVPSGGGGSDQFGATMIYEPVSQSLFVGAPRDDGSGAGINPEHNNLTTNSGALYQFKVTQDLLAPVVAPAGREFHRGDANADGELNLGDPVSALGALFLGELELPCADAADADDSGKVDVTDPVYLLNFLFGGGAPPAAPFAECGQDPTPDNLRCDSVPSC